MSGLVPPRVQQDASLAFDPNQQGKSAEQINEAIDASHLGPSWGTEYKVKPYVKGEVAGGAEADYYFDTSIDPYQISANRGETLAVGGRISGQIGIQFGPYFPGTMIPKEIVP
ncbi:polymorphic toxin type 25 domain-containing protein [Yersinia rohdei]|uniref:polymorphic toxin type 25 domain-containing protein n=1 Tax=Yersinia rohdei TaxID=29485 RepID=UPI0039E109C8